MENIITLKIDQKEKDLRIKELQDQRLVTFRDIDDLHERKDGTARRNFIQNRTHFTKGEDYFFVDSVEASKLGITAPSGLNLLTESGYLLLVKSFNDDLAWQVQKQLVKTYFRFKEAEHVGFLAVSEASAKAVELAYQSGAKPPTRYEILRRFWKSAGIELPDIFAVDEDNQERAIEDLLNRRLTKEEIFKKALCYLSTKEIAYRVGVYHNGWAHQPNVTVINAIIRAEKVTVYPEERDQSRYLETVVYRIRRFLEMSGLPTELQIAGKIYHFTIEDPNYSLMSMTLKAR